MSRYTDRSSSLTARQLLALSLTALLIATAGCSGFLGSDGNGGKTSEDGQNEVAPINSVPKDVDTVMQFKSGIIEDSTTVTLMNGLIEMGSSQIGGSEQMSYEEILQKAENESELSRDGFNSLTVFARSATIEQEQYVGAVADTEWSWEQLISASNTTMADVESQLTEDSYNGVTIYRSKQTAGQTNQTVWIADFGGGTYAMGTEQAVKDVIDTRKGKLSTFGGKLRKSYNSTKDGYMKAAVLVPEEQVQQASNQTGVNSDIAPTPKVMTMSYYTDGNTMSFDTRMTMAKEEDAKNLESTVRFGLNALKNQESGQNKSPTKMLANAVAVEQNKKAVTVSVSMTPEKLLEVLKLFQQSRMGTAPSIGSSHTTTTSP